MTGMMASPCGKDGARAALYQQLLFMSDVANSGAAYEPNLFTLGVLPSLTLANQGEWSSSGFVEKWTEDVEERIREIRLAGVSAPGAPAPLTSGRKHLTLEEFRAKSKYGKLCIPKPPPQASEPPRSMGYAGGGIKRTFPGTNAHGGPDAGVNPTKRQANGHENRNALLGSGGGSNMSSFRSGRGSHGQNGNDRFQYHTEADENRNDAPNTSSFQTARERFVQDQHKKNGGQGGPNGGQGGANGAGGPVKKSLGGKRRGFVPPVRRDEDEDGGGGGYRSSGARLPFRADDGPGEQGDNSDLPERLRQLDPKLIETISNEIIDHSPGVTWDDIAGLDYAKKSVMEIVVWPLLRPDIFTGLRGPPKGLLLFGPPGTGKTLIGKAIATESGATFFSISASSLTSKWVGEGEKMVRALFGVASCHQPAVIFIDEIDSLLTQRSESDQESSRRIKTEFLVQLDGAATSGDERILVVGATNRPQELDEAARRRLVKRLYIPLPDKTARASLVRRLLQKQENSLNDQNIEDIAEQTEGYSGADMRALCTEAALGPIRNITDIRNMTAADVRPVQHDDFVHAIQQVRPSVSPKEIQHYIEWNTQFGSFQIP